MRWLPTIEKIDCLAPPFNITVFVAKSIEEAVRYILANDGTVSGLVGTKIYPPVVPQGVSLPVVTYQQITGVRDEILSGPTGLTKARFQINSWAATYTVSESLSEAVRLALDGYSGVANQVTIHNAILDSEGNILNLIEGAQASKQYGKRLDFIIWYKEELN